MHLPFVLIVVFGGIVSLITGIARRLGAARWLAVSIPNFPLGLFLACCLIFEITIPGNGGAFPLWMLAGILLMIALPASLITVFIVPKRHDTPNI